MYVHIQKLLTTEHLETLDAGLVDATFVDGAKTAGPAGRVVKENLQIDKKNPRTPRSWIRSS
jgi:predicted 2-oxoglutarate/Fe(II)-dependent dioxygenase YbiX